MAAICTQKIAERLPTDPLTDRAMYSNSTRELFGLLLGFIGNAIFGGLLGNVCPDEPNLICP